MESFRLSVRQLVEFALPGDDLVFATGDPTKLIDGTLAHQHRQKAFASGWKAEVSLSLVTCHSFGELVISGRMDGFFQDDDLPQIEEIKHYSAQEELVAPAAVHLAQAVCYGHILCQTKGVTKVQLLVSYVNLQGEILYQFTQQRDKASLAQEFQEYLDLYVAWTNLHLAHQQKRDLALESLCFPYSRYRQGQRELAVQVFTAIDTGKRLLASLPTGTGKTAGVLFPALKALARGHMKQVFYLTARGTGKESPLQFFSLLKKNTSLPLRVLTLTAKEKICPHVPRLSCSDCPYALGYYQRLPQALEAFFHFDQWQEELIGSLCQKHQVCPFECSLTLAQVADVVIGDYNYFFDPTTRLQRALANPKQLSLLIDEAHHLPQRVRDMLCARLCGPSLYDFRRQWGKAYGRTHPVYKSLSSLLAFFKTDLSPLQKAFEQNAVDDHPLWKTLLSLCEQVRLALFTHVPVTHSPLFSLYEETSIALYHFLQMGKTLPACYALLLQGQEKTLELTLFATDVSDYVAKLTTPLQGTVAFSATLSPLEATGQLLGFAQGDALFSLPSPFPKDRLLVLRKPIDTRYKAREATAQEVATVIEETFRARPGKYMVYFPSFAYLSLVYAHLAQDSSMPYLLQRRDMTDADREVFLSTFGQTDCPTVGLCVMGGIFSEGIDLPGEQLIGAIVVGVGLPMVSLTQETLRTHFSRRFGNGFAYAYRYPGMQKVLQAAGRVIRHEEDWGVVVLIDQRYFQKEYQSLCPDHWQFERESLTAFWQRLS
ncbi:MAG: ATP-dependent DNA helicase [Clostridiales bacterium]|nr:ATP-dependent DNA helicase [Clostridiales bacterium]